MRTSHNTLTVAADRALYLGELPATGWHRHPLPVLLMGLSGRFAVHLPGGRVERCSSALIDTGVDHVFDPCGEQVALVYVEPDAPEARSLRTHFEQAGGVLFEVAAPARSRSATDTRLHSFDLQALLRLRLRPAPAVDARVTRTLQLLRAPEGGPFGRQAAAEIAMLSSSRFNHLFRAEMGVSFRSYRVWSQLRIAMTRLGPRVSLTQAALDGAFSDSSHFSRTFRQTFGMTPSSVLKPLRGVSLL